MTKASGTRSELNYVIAGAILLIGGGYIVKFGQDEDAIAGIVVGAVLALTGIYLLIRGVAHGRR